MAARAAARNAANTADPSMLDLRKDGTRSGIMSTRRQISTLSRMASMISTGWEMSWIDDWLRSSLGCTVFPVARSELLTSLWYATMPTVRRNCHCIRMTATSLSMFS